MFERKWENDEVRALFNEVEKAKSEGRSIKSAFSAHAQKYSRRPNSVRNYYYHEVDDLMKNKSRLKELGIDISKHSKQEVKFFSEKEGEKIVEAVEKLVKEGNSVRQACLKLSGGNVALMLRYQNKYRNEQLKKETNSMAKPINILDYKNKQRALTELDINSLFMGLVKLVKKMAFEEATSTLFKERDSMSFLLKKTLSELERKEKEVEVLKENCKTLQIENERLSERISSLRFEKAEVIAKKISNGRLPKEQIIN